MPKKNSSETLSINVGRRRATDQQRSRDLSHVSSLFLTLQLWFNWMDCCSHCSFYLFHPFDISLHL
jgi:hypothetical protein